MSVVLLLWKCKHTYGVLREDELACMFGAGGVVKSGVNAVKSGKLEHIFVIGG
jgi:hypothetical protein